MTDSILASMKQCVPQRRLRDHKSTHPWLTDHVMTKLAAELAAKGTIDEAVAQTECSDALRTAYNDYVVRSTENLQSISNGCKLWWKRSRELLRQQSSVSSIPPLKDAKGTYKKK